MLLIDSDFLAYKAAQACEIGIDFGEDVIIAQSQFSEVLKVFNNELNKVTKAMMEDDFIPVSYTHLTLPTIYSV